MPNLYVNLYLPFMPNGLFYINSLDRSIFYIRGVWLVFIIIMSCFVEIPVFNETV